MCEEHFKEYKIVSNFDRIHKNALKKFILINNQ